MTIIPDRHPKGSLRFFDEGVVDAARGGGGRVSIHAPLARCDLILDHTFSPSLGFNSRASCEARPLSFAIAFEVAEDFRSDDDDSAFVVHLDHKLKLVAVSKIKPEELASDDFISRLSRKVVAERASDLWMLFCGSAPVDVAGLLERGMPEKLHKPLVDVIYPKDGAAYGHASLAYNYKDAAGWTNDAIRVARTMGLTKDAAKKWLAKRKAPPPMQGNATPADGGIHFRSAASIAPSTTELAEAQRQYDAVVARYTNPDGTKKPGWMKAPNGKPTRLTERQWVQVRTPNFRNNFFGDWLAYAVSGLSESGISLDEARRRIDEMRGRDFVNEGTGVSVRLSSDARGKLVSNKATGKSKANGFTAEQHNEVAAKVGDLFAIARRLESRPDRDGDANILSIQCYAAPVRIGEQTAFAWITVKESKQHGAHIYSVEEIKLEALARKVGQAKTDTTHAASASTTQILRQQAEKVNPSSVSKVVDENGEPRVVWRGAPFDPLAQAPGKGVIAAGIVRDRLSKFHPFQHRFLVLERRLFKHGGNCWVNTSCENVDDRSTSGIDYAIGNDLQQ